MGSQKKLAKNTTAALMVLASCASLHAQTFIEDFGNSASRVSNTYVGSSFTFSSSGTVVDGQYTVMRPQNITGSTGQAYWANLTTDHTGTADGALMVLNAGATLDDIYVRNFNMLPGHSYRVTG